MKVLRLTRHPMDDRQKAELQRVCGLLLGCEPAQVEAVEIAETVPDVERVKAIIAEHGAHVLEAVLPLPLMAQCVDTRNGVGIPVLRAITIRKLESDGTATFDFSHYERIVKVEVVTERL